VIQYILETFLKNFVEKTLSFHIKKLNTFTDFFGTRDRLTK